MLHSCRKPISKSRRPRPAPPRNGRKLTLEQLEPRRLLIMDPMGGSGEDHLQPESYMPAVGIIHSFDFWGKRTIGTGTLIRPQWVLTAAHVINGLETERFIIGGQEYRAIENWAIAPGDRQRDIGLLKLDRPVTNVTPMPMYSSTPAVGTSSLLVGYGISGTGTSGVIEGTQGKKRAGMVRIDSADSIALYSNFNRGESSGAGGDSGGPLIVKVPINVSGRIEQRFFVSAIHVSSSTEANRYGDVDRLVKVGPFIQTLRGFMGEGSGSGGGRFIIGPGGTPEEDGGQDTQPPVISGGNELRVRASSPQGASVNFAGLIQASDDFDIEPDLTFSHQSGAQFPLGTTRVTATATDEAGNLSTFEFNVVVEGSDLIPLSIEAQATVSFGASFFARSELLNQGNAAVASAGVSFYISSDGTIDASDRLLKRVDVSLAADERRLLEEELSLAGVSTGRYYLGMIIDVDGQVIEFNEANNVSSAIPLDVVSADLVVTTLDGPEIATLVDHSLGSTVIEVATAVENQGSSASGEYEFQYMLEPLDGLSWSNEPVLTVTRPGIARGESQVWSQQLTLPGTWQLVGGQYTLVSILDGRTYRLVGIADPAGLVFDTNRANNRRADDQPLTGRGIDFQVDQVDGPSQAAAGTQIDVHTTASLLLDGFGTQLSHFLTDSPLPRFVADQVLLAAHEFRLTYYLSLDPTITGDDFEIGSVTQSFAAAGSWSWTDAVALPHATAAGTYYLGAIVDSADQFAEKLEANNSRTDMEWRPYVFWGYGFPYVQWYLEPQPIVITDPPANLVQAKETPGVEPTITLNFNEPVFGDASAVRVTSSSGEQIVPRSVQGAGTAELKIVLPSNVAAGSYGVALGDQFGFTDAGGNLVDGDSDGFAGGLLTFAVAARQTITIAGTSGNDSFSFKAGAEHSLTVNRNTYSFDASRVARLKLNGGAGRDSITITGTSGNDTAMLQVGNTRVTGQAYRLEAEAFEIVQVYAGGGLDKAYLYDSAGNDRLVAAPTYATMKGSGYSHRVEAFDQVYGIAKLGGLADRADLYDSIGADRFDGKPTEAILRGSSFYNSARGFDRVYAHSTSVGRAKDVASLFDARGADTFTGKRSTAQLAGAGYLTAAIGFNEVQIRGTAGGINTKRLSAIDYVLKEYGTWR